LQSLNRPGGADDCNLLESRLRSLKAATWLREVQQPGFQPGCSPLNRPGRSRKAATRLLCNLVAKNRRYVEPVPSRREGRYSTVTVFARFRGWSTFRPRSRRDPVGEQLERDERERGLQERRCPRDVDHVVGVMLDVLVALVAIAIKWAPRARSLDVRDDLVVDVDVGRDDDDGCPLLEQRIGRAYLACRIGSGRM